MKKLTSLLIVLVLVVGAVFALTACDQTDKDAPTTVMNVSLNPEVEFVLDGHGKVVTVNALNEDGNLIITATAFEGKTARGHCLCIGDVAEVLLLANFTKVHSFVTKVADYFSPSVMV